MEDVRVRYGVVALAVICCGQFIAMLFFAKQLDETQRELVRFQSRVHIAEAEIEGWKRDIRSFITLRATPLRPLDDSDFAIPVVTIGEELTGPDAWYGQEPSVTIEEGEVSR